MSFKELRANMDQINKRVDQNGLTRRDVAEATKLCMRFGLTPAEERFEGAKDND